MYPTWWKGARTLLAFCLGPLKKQFELGPCARLLQLHKLLAGSLHFIFLLDHTTIVFDFYFLVFWLSGKTPVRFVVRLSPALAMVTSFRQSPLPVLFCSFFNLMKVGH